LDELCHTWKPTNVMNDYIVWLEDMVWIKKKHIFVWRLVICLDNVPKCDVEVPKKSEYSNLLNQNS